MLSLSKSQNGGQSYGKCFIVFDFLVMDDRKGYPYVIIIHGRFYVLQFFHLLA